MKAGNLVQSKRDIKKSESRVVYADITRIFAFFLVCVTHVCSPIWSVSAVDSTRWDALNLFSSFSRVCVPLFLMLSGIFFLDPEKNITYKKLYGKSIPKVALALLFWASAYAVVDINTAQLPWSLKQFISSIVFNHFHLWFLYVIIGLYILTPLLRVLTAHLDRRGLEYYLLIIFVMSSVVPLIQQSQSFACVMIATIMGNLVLYFAIGWVGYFILGYYLHKYTFSKKIKIVLWSLGIISGIITVVATKSISLLQGDVPNKLLYEYRMPNVFFMSIAAFTAFKEIFSKISFSEKTEKFLSKISALTFKAYLVHEFINILFKQLGFTADIWNTFVMVPIVSVVTALVSLICAYILDVIMKFFKKLFSRVSFRFGRTARQN